MGLAAMFGLNFVIISLAVVLDIAKLTVVSFLYTHWKDAPKYLKPYMIIATLVLMLITSAGAFSYLSGEFQKSIVGTQEGALKVEVLKKQQEKYEERKKQIDEQIAKLPEKTTVTQRLKLMNGFKTEQQALQDKITEIDKQLPELQIKQISTEAKAGPILYIAKAFDIPVEQAVKYVILMIIFVFDPLAVFLIIAGNFLLIHNRKKAEVAKPVETIVEEPVGDECNIPPEGLECTRKPGHDGPCAVPGVIAQDICEIFPEAFIKQAPEEYDRMPKTYDDTEMHLIKDPIEDDEPSPKTYDDTFVEHVIMPSTHEATPATPEVEEPKAPTPEVTEVPKTPPVSPPREVITREQLIHNGGYAPSTSLSHVVADDSVTFDQTPTGNFYPTSSHFYSNLK